MARVFVTQDIDPAGFQILRDGGHEIDLRIGDGPVGRGELLERVSGCEGLLPMLTDRVDGEVMDAGPLRAVCVYAVGVDNVDLCAARERGVVVTNTPGVLTEATADLAMALMLSAARRIVEADRFVREGRFLAWHPTLLRGADLYGARLGVVGFGRIGQAVAERGRAFGMDVVWCSSRAGMDLDELLATSDVVSLHCPLTPATRHLVDRGRLAAMKPGAILINTARGPVVDEAALVDALRAGHLFAAGLDVFEREPEVHPGLLQLQNVVMAPHLGSATVRTRRRMAVMAARNMVAALADEEPPNRV